jgi:hypothetical protein
MEDVDTEDMVHKEGQERTLEVHFHNGAAE